MLIFHDPIPDGIETVYVLGCSPKCGTSTVARLIGSYGHVIVDVGIEVEQALSKLTSSDALIYVVDAEFSDPEWMFDLSFTHFVLTVNFNQLYYDETTWALMQTDHALLCELEKLLPPDNPVKQEREVIRARYTQTSVE